jgi:glycosyltransferase involved in cell wall biosynthesis
LKILQITPSYKPAFVYGGTTISVSQLCEALVEAGHEVTVLTTTANGKTELPKQEQQPAEVSGVQVYYFGRLTKDHTHFSPNLLAFLYKNVCKYDVVHIQSWWNLVAVFAVFVCFLRGVKPVLSPRGMLSSYSFEHENSLKKQLIHKLIGRKLLAQTYLHATAKAEFEEGRQIIATWQGFTLPNILPLPALKIVDKQPQKENKTETNKLHLLFLSRIDHKKGLELFFESLAIVKQELDKQQLDFQLDIIGGGEQNYVENLQNLAAKLGLQHQIVWHGRIEGEKRFAYYAKADVFLLPSYNENFANVVIEALSQGTAVLVSSFVGLASYVQENDLGVVTSLEKKVMAEKLLALLLDYKKRAKIREIAPQKIKLDFDKQNLVKQYIEQYQLVSRLQNSEDVIF